MFSFWTRRLQPDPSPRFGREGRVLDTQSTRKLGLGLSWKCGGRRSILVYFRFPFSPSSTSDFGESHLTGSHPLLLIVDISWKKGNRDVDFFYSNFHPKNRKNIRPLIPLPRHNKKSYYNLFRRREDSYLLITTVSKRVTFRQSRCTPSPLFGRTLFCLCWVFRRGHGHVLAPLNEFFSDLTILPTTKVVISVFPENSKRSC